MTLRVAVVGRPFVSSTLELAWDEPGGRIVQTVRLAALGKADHTECMALQPGDITLAARVDEATVDSDGRRLATGIDGVLLRMLGPLQADHRGSLLEVVDTQHEFWDEPIVYGYRITVRPGRIKGWGMHMLQSDRYLTLSGRLRVVLYDGRTSSPSHGQFAEFPFTDETPGLLLIPPGVWHADQNTGDRDAVLINFPTRAYDHDNPDKYRIDPWSGEIPFDWTLRDY